MTLLTLLDSRTHRTLDDRWADVTRRTVYLVAAARQQVSHAAEVGRAVGLGRRALAATVVTLALARRVAAALEVRR